MFTASRREVAGLAAAYEQVVVLEYSVLVLAATSGADHPERHA